MNNHKEGSKIARRNPPYKLNHIYRKDAWDGLSKLDTGSVALCILDPPYNIASTQKLSLSKNTIVSTHSLWGDWDSMEDGEYDAYMTRVLGQCYRTLKSGGSLYCFCSHQKHGFFLKTLATIGFKYHNTLALVKRNPVPSIRKTNWRSAFELCVYLSKDKRATFNFLSQKECVNVFHYVIGRKETTHPTEKPLDFIKLMVQVSSKNGELVVDPFSGSGTTAVACVETGRNFIGFDASTEYTQMARRRVKMSKGKRKKR